MADPDALVDMLQALVAEVHWLGGMLRKLLGLLVKLLGAS